ncbi:MAG: 4-hydroxy-3-methylbut-2-enyl diphosphate reductase [Micavibrio sp.]|nr:4-hydroxy-3-methylbut-2-enyl diphosphate reductase [Micavibrio sp.]MBK9563555.1 4-hydroxy-3-methylbut-2-enyl diphosphate reductase [Micavibrio sp.]
MNKQPLTVLLASPRGFCAGVDRAIQIVEKALIKYGAPVYVRHEIVHNKYVVDSLRAKGAVFIEELDEIPQGHEDRPVIFSAHGVPKSVPENARAREMFYIDATCPLVSKVHWEAERYHKNGNQIILIGHAGHPEVIGTMGQLPPGAVILVETTEDVEKLHCHSERSEESQTRSFAGAQDDTFVIKDTSKLAYCTQTTLSVDDTAEIVTALQKKFPQMQGPHKEDICYATTNRQAAVKAIAPSSDAIIVIGAPNSSNSMRLVEVAALNGCPKSTLVQRASEINWEWLDGVKSLGLSAGASAPEVLVDEVIERLRERFEVTIREISIIKEDVHFKVPHILNDTSSPSSSRAA